MKRVKVEHERVIGKASLARAWTCVICRRSPASRRAAIKGAPVLCVQCFRDQFVGSLGVEVGRQVIGWFLRGKATPEELP